MSIAEQLQETTALSPFIEDTFVQWAWDATSLGYLKTCPRLYWYTIIEGWRPKSDNIDLRFGGEVHKAVEHYHKGRAQKLTHDEALYDVILDTLYRIDGWNPDTETRAGKYKNRFTLLRTIVDYLDHYENDPASTVLKPNGEPAVELTFRIKLEFAPTDDASQPYELCGHIDRVVDFQENRFGLDTKTTTQTLGSYYFDQWEPNNQMTLYTIAVDALQSDAHVKGVVIDAIQVMQNETRCVRSITYRTQAQLTEWLEDLTYWLGVAQYYAHANYWPMNDTACPRCRFRDICSKDPAVREKFLEGNFVKGEQWNPLIPR